MANSSIFLSDLKPGRVSSTIQVPLLRFWKARNVRATIMQASVNVSRLATYGLYLRAGSMYSFTGFDVTQCNQNFRLSHSSLLIRFSDATTLAELTEPSSPIPKECFRFRNHSEMLGLANTNTQLPGKSEDSDVLETKGYLLIILFPTISPLPEMGSSSVLEKVKEVREKVEVKKETYSIGRRLLVMCLILALMEVFFQDHVLAWPRLLHCPSAVAQSQKCPSGGELMSLDMLLLDSKARPLCKHPLSDSSLLIRFSDATAIAALTEPSSPIPKECFRFRNHSEMLGLANTNTQLLGKSEDSEVLETKGYLLIILFLTISPLPPCAVLESRI
ncbi:hypothetical protein DY000_02038011 [Brassica cretica]|uniref:Uncharacterized protein n=1 Tax=Brassica cretica TaxID=69181 RepID=A0ABQ7BM88_BRACR|nr:hypothetical protein DY000_02038011 [Brassica cretica]